MKKGWKIAISIGIIVLAILIFYFASKAITGYTGYVVK
jgi:hypothetical protein